MHQYFLYFISFFIEVQSFELHEQLSFLKQMFRKIISKIFQMDLESLKSV